MFDQVEKLKREFTDKYVLVNENVPELARFGGHVGQVKTVNMNGRALVQFDTWNNIGWYDIELDALRVVPKPDPAATEAKKHDAKKDAPRPATKSTTTGAAPAAGEKKLSPLEMARMQGAAKSAGAAPAAGGAKKSTADILAAARAKGSAPAADKPAAPTKAAPPAPKPAAGGKMSTADILAAARAKKAAEMAEPEEAATQAPAAEEAVTAAPLVEKSAKPASKTTFTPGQRPSVPEILAWCREHDAK